MISCTRKIPKMEFNRLKELSFHSLKNYPADVYKAILEKVSIPNYENFDNSDIANSGFITRFD